MTAEVVKVEETQNVVEVVVKKEEPKTVEKCSSYKEESNLVSDLKDCERKALNELKSKLEDAILTNTLFKKEEPKKNEQQPVDATEEREKAVAEEKIEEEQAEKRKNEAEKPKQGEAKEEKEEKPVQEEAKEEEERKPADEDEKEKAAEDGEKKEKKEPEEEEKFSDEVDKDIALWGVPLLPSKGAEGIDVILLKFLRAREFKVNDAFEMLRKTLLWRKENNIDSVLDEDLGDDLSSAAYMNGVDREGRPVCYNTYGVFENDELYQKTFGTEEERGLFLRWRLRLMERGIQKLDLKPAGVSSLLQIHDLKNCPGLAKKEIRAAMKQAVDLLQDNYPEFVARNVGSLNSS